MYKLPKLETEPKGSLLLKGKAYAYMTSKGPAKWTLSSKGIDDQTSIFGRTWHDFNNKKVLVVELICFSCFVFDCDKMLLMSFLFQFQTSDTASMFYNDNAPEPYTKSAVGHLKGGHSKHLSYGNANLLKFYKVIPSILLTLL